MHSFYGPVRFTLFFSQFADRKRQCKATLPEIAEKIRFTTARDKPLLPWIKLATFGDVPTGNGSLRHDANVLEITGIEADYDGELVGLSFARERLEKEGLASILYTSPSHTDAHPRWRVLCPLSTPMEPVRRRHMMGRLNGLFGGIFSGESWTVSQSYYFGSVCRNPAHRVQVIDGSAIDLHDDLDESWIGKPGTFAPDADLTNRDLGEACEDAELVRRIVTGQGFHVELCALAGRYLARGMTRHAAAEVLHGLMLSHPDEARDARWRDRCGSIPGLLASAEAKFRDETADGRRAVARVIAKMMRDGSSAPEIRTAAFNEAERHGLAPKAAEDIAAWLCQRKRARLGGDHA